MHIESIYLLSQRDRWGKFVPVAEHHYPTMEAARMVADQIELSSGHRVAIDRIDTDGKAYRVRGPEE